MTATPSSRVRDDEEIADSSAILTEYPDMRGKVAVVTGAARGLGATIVDDLLDQGVDVLGADLDIETMNSLEVRSYSRASTGGVERGRLRAVRIDVAEAVEHRTVGERAVAEFGRLDFWVNNVGIFPHADVLDISAEQMSTTMKLNVDSVLFGAQAAAAQMLGGGAIVNISSTAGRSARRGRAAYGTSKAAVTRLTKSLAVELAEAGVRVNSVAPGFVDTTMTGWIQNDRPRLESVLEAIPLHRFASTTEVSAAVLFLLSDSARYITGAELAVDGGGSA